MTLDTNSPRGGARAQYQDLSKPYVPPGYRGRSAIYVQFWWIVQAFLFNPSPQFMYAWRRALLRAFGAEIGKGVLIRPSARITYPWKVRIGNYSWIGDRVELYSLDTITIGDNAVVSQNSYICTGSHDHNQLNFPLTLAPVVIEDEAWVASGSFVKPGVTVGRGAIVGACSVVLKDVPSATIVAGNPARILGKRHPPAG